MMDIEYTYREEERPIEKAEFNTTGGTPITIQTDDSFWPIIIKTHALFIASFNESDWHDFTKLVNRLNKQIGNEV